MDRPLVVAAHTHVVVSRDRRPGHPRLHHGGEFRRQPRFFAQGPPDPGVEVSERGGIVRRRGEPLDRDTDLRVLPATTQEGRQYPLPEAHGAGGRDLPRL
ncbi:hypothetical protein ABZ620_07365 [Nocardiopsis alba]|uniref:hypothetical protein n=1 Tax=Nocardiopsis alba TaxID=53437 RepID=UPI003401A0DC